MMSSVDGALQTDLKAEDDVEEVASEVLNLNRRPALKAKASEVE